jgi:glycosyltransferase involved in cell wall biosynthesis
MLTRNRRAFVPLAVECFLRQDYENRELVVADDGDHPIGSLLPIDSRIRYVRLDGTYTVGAKRNLACAQARGDYLFHWDDDDWYPPWRIRRQMNEFAQTGLDISGSSEILYYDGVADQAWRYSYALNGSSWVCGNTLAYRKGYWERYKFPDLQIGEDAKFIWAGGQNGVIDMRDASICVAMIHAGNTCTKVTSGPYWNKHPTEEVQYMLGDDWWFYRAAAANPVLVGSTPLPTVSCIMPTRNRRRFVTLAVQRFIEQDYPFKELVIVDDGTDPVGDLVSDASNILHIQLAGRHSIGAKRNLACAKARGEIIVHWDDDDWYSPQRLRIQVEPIWAGRADITGIQCNMIAVFPSGELWGIDKVLHERMFEEDVHGGTLAYRKSIWAEGCAFEDVNLAEDACFLRLAVAKGHRLERIRNPGCFVYVRHSGNAWKFEPGKFLEPCRWTKVRSPAKLQQALAQYGVAALDVEHASAVGEAA